MKYAVKSEFYDNGKVNAEIIDVDDSTTNQYCQFERFDRYIDVFDTYKEAEIFLTETQKA